MRIRVSRAQALDAYMRGECVWIAPESWSYWDAFGVSSEAPRSRRRASRYFRHFYMLSGYPRHERMAYWLDQ